MYTRSVTPLFPPFLGFSMASLARSSLLQISGKLLGIFFGLATFYLLLHFFGTEGYGVFTTALTYVTFFSIVVDFGLTITTAQMIAEKGADEQKILSNLFALRIVSALAFMMLAPLSAWFLPGTEKVFPLICIGSATYFFGAIAQMFLGVFQKRLELATPVIAEMLSRALSLAGILFVGLTTQSLLHATFAFTLGAAVQLVIMLFATHRRIPLRLSWDFSVWKNILSRSWPIGLSIFFNLLYLKGDVLFLWGLGKSDWEIGQYGAAYKVVDILTMVPVTFMGLVLPLLTLAWTSQDRGGFTRRMQQTIDLFAVISIPCIFGAWALGVPLMTAVKPDLALAGQLLWVLVPAAVVVFFGSLFGHAVVALQAQRPMTWNYCIVAVLGVAGYLLLVPPFGAWGAAWVTLFCEAAIALLAYVVIRKRWKASLSFLIPLKALVASVVMFFALELVQYFFAPFSPVSSLLLSFAIGVLVYFLALSAVQGPTLRDAKKLLAADARQS
ncbi:flippase [bacterium]|nr:flippase [bacterium]